MSGMNKFVYGERTVYEKEGRYIKHSKGEFAGEGTRAEAFAWLYEGDPYELEIHSPRGGLTGVIRNRGSGCVVASAMFYRQDNEGDRELFSRLYDWAARYMKHRDILAAKSAYEALIFERAFDETQH
jgi:hypothetical protein